MYHIFYKTVCPATSEYYYGIHSTLNINDGYQGSGTRIKELQRDGVHLITGVVSIHNTRSELLLKESTIVTPELLSDPLCLNIAQGGVGINCSDISKRIKDGLNNRSDVEKNAQYEKQKQRRNSDAYKYAAQRRLDTINSDSVFKEEWTARMRESNRQSYTEERRQHQSAVMIEKYQSLSQSEKDRRANSQSNKMKGRIWVVNASGTSFFAHSKDDSRLEVDGPWRRGKKWHSSNEL